MAVIGQKGAKMAKGKPKFQPGDVVLVTARVIHEDEDGLVKVAILDGTLPILDTCFIWATSLQRTTDQRRRGKGDSR